MKENLKKKKKSHLFLERVFPLSLLGGGGVIWTVSTLAKMPYLSFETLPSSETLKNI